MHSLTVTNHKLFMCSGYCKGWWKTSALFENEIQSLSRNMTRLGGGRICHLVWSLSQAGTRGRGSLQRPCITKTGQFLRDYLAASRWCGLLFSSERWETRRRFWALISDLWHRGCTASTQRWKQARSTLGLAATWSYSKHSRNRGAWFTLILPVTRLRWQIFQPAEVNQAPLKCSKIKWHLQIHISRVCTLV